MTNDLSVRRRSSSAGIAADTPQLTGRVDGKRRHGPVKFGISLKRKFLNLIGVRSESRSPKTMPNSFLAELWNRGSRYSSVATLRALIHLAESKTAPDYSGMDKESAFRLRKNLLDHGELPHAIKAVRQNVESWKSSDRKTKLLEFLDGLLETLKENFDELSHGTGQTGVKGRKPDAQEQDRLCGVLRTAAYKLAAGERKSPAELVQAQLSKLDGKPVPAAAPTSPPDLRLLQDQANFGEMGSH
jgi:hypothetical protein